VAQGVGTDFKPQYKKKKKLKTLKFFIFTSIQCNEHDSNEVFF
jgi:hypothetical protein